MRIRIKVIRKKLNNAVATKLAGRQADVVNHHKTNLAHWPSVKIWRWNMDVMINPTIFIKIQIKIDLMHG